MKIETLELASRVALELKNNAIENNTIDTLLEEFILIDFPVNIEILCGQRSEYLSISKNHFGKLLSIYKDLISSQIVADNKKFDGL